jgi:uncharacterized Rossmann fold enzyme
MATLYLAEFDRLLTDADGKTVMAPHYPPVAPEQTITIAGTSAQCAAAFSGRTRFIQVSADHACSIAINANPTADATLTRLAANEKQFLGVERGHFIAVITNS